MKLTYDSEKNEANISKHGISFDRVTDYDWQSIFIKEDERYAYGEIRYSSYIMLNKRLYNLVFTERSGDVRVISFRKANEKERKKYEKAYHRI